MPRVTEATGLCADHIVEGTHVYNPPVGQVLMDDPNSPFYDRGYGFYSEEQRRRYIASSVRIGGVGGGGLTLAVMLAKSGVCDFSIADVDEVDPTNVGRIPLLTPDDIGRPKVEVAARLITQHNPCARVRVYGRGVQLDNVDEFVGLNAGNKGATVVFDEIDLNEPLAALRLHRAARKFGHYTIAATDVEKGGLVTTFSPRARRYNFEHYNGAKASDSEEEYVRKVKGFQLPTIPNIPTTGDTDTLLAVQKKGVPLPTTLRSVLIATDLALDEFERVVGLGMPRNRRPHLYPRVHCANTSRGEDFVTRFPRTVSTGRVVRLVARDFVGLNPSASYSDGDRTRRAEYRQQVAAGVTR